VGVAVAERKAGCLELLPRQPLQKC